MDTFTGGWYNPRAVMQKIEEKFPNSEALALSEYPSAWNLQRALEKATHFEDVVMITYQDSQAYIGRECLSSRIVSYIDALQVTDKIATLVHFGNPYVLEDLVHIKRILIAPCAKNAIDAAFEVLVGNYPAKGKLTYDIFFE